MNTRSAGSSLAKVPQSTSRAQAPAQTLARKKTDPRIKPALTKTLTPQYEDMEAEEEDEDLNVTPMEIINEEEKTLTAEEEALLSLRQVFKKKTANLIRAEAHREFAKECIQMKVALKGLRINVRRKNLGIFATMAGVRSRSHHPHTGRTNYS